MKTLEFAFTGPVIVHVRRGDVVVRGQQERTTGQLASKTAGDQEVIVVEDGITHLYATSDLSLNVPAGTAVQILGHAQDVVLRMLGDVTLETCHGDLAASDVASLQIQAEVHGDVALRTATGPVSAGHVHGDMAAAAVADLRVASVDGDVSISGAGNVAMGSVQGDIAAHHCASVQVRSVAGDATVKNITGSIDLKKVDGNVAVIEPGATLAVTVQGDASVSGDLLPGGAYWINAGGKVSARIGGGARLAVHSKGRIHTGANVKVVSQSTGVLEATIGETAAAAALHVEAGGDVTIAAPDQGGWQRADGASLQMQQVMDQANAEVGRELAQAQEEMQRAIREVENAAMRTESGMAFPSPTSPAGAAGAGASWRSLLKDLFDSLDPHKGRTTPSPAGTQPKDEVRTVLDMLAAGKITAEEAERLLDALRP